MAYTERMRRTLVARTADWLCRKSWPRTIAFAAAAVGGGTAWLVVDGLQALGVRPLWLQWPTGVLAWLAVVGLSLWAWAERHRPLTPTDLLDGAPPQPVADDPDRPNPDYHENIHDAKVEASPDGLLGLMCFLAIFAGPVLLLVWWLRAPWRMGELLVDHGKVRRQFAGRAAAVSAGNAVWRQWRWPALALTVHYLLLGALANAIAPQAGALAELIPAPAEEQE